MINFAEFRFDIPRQCPNCSDIDSFLFDEHRMKKTRRNRVFLICTHCSSSFPASDPIFRGVETYPLHVELFSFTNLRPF